MRKPRKIALLAACALLSAPYANAATISGPSGAVFVSEGRREACSPRQRLRFPAA